MESLVLIALHQPLTRSEIEQIRGVALPQSTMDVLLESGLIKPWGRRDTPGRPTLWVTTPRFLSQFGLRSLRDLPGSSLAPEVRRLSPEPIDADTSAPDEGQSERSA